MFVIYNVNALNVLPDIYMTIYYFLRKKIDELIEKEKI